MYIVKNTHLEVIQKYNDKKCYSVTLKNYALAAKHVDLQESSGQIMSETKLSNEVTVYNDENMFDQFHFLIKAYSSIWNDNNNVINMSESEHMLVLMTDK